MKSKQNRESIANQFKIRCSAIGQIMTNPKGGSPMDKYLKAKKTIEEKEAKYDATKNKETKNAMKLRDSIQQLKDELTELEAHKDDVVLSKTAQTYCEDWIKEKVYGRRKVLDTKALHKGVQVENEAIFVLNKALGTNYTKSIYKPGEKMENDWMTGHEDIDDTENKMIIDTKASYSFSTFPLLKDTIENDYYRQGQGYMCLKGEEYQMHKVAKVLVNSPSRIIKQELYRRYMTLTKKYEGAEEYLDEEYEPLARQVFKQHVFDRQVSIMDNGGTLQLTEDEVIPYEERVHLFDVPRDDKDIEAIKKRVEECRKRIAQQGY